MKNKKQAFLDNYPKFLRTTRTAAAIGVNECTIYRWLARDDTFKQAMQEVKKRIDKDRLEENEAEIHRRGLEKSDLLLMFETKKLEPEYRERPLIDKAIIGDITVKLPYPPYETKLLDNNTT